MVEGTATAADTEDRDYWKRREALEAALRLPRASLQEQADAVIKDAEKFFNFLAGK